MLWPSFQNPLSLVLYQTAFNSGKLSERSFSKAKYELKGNGFLLMTMAQNWVSSFQTLKFAADISDFKTYFFLIMNLWIFLLVVGQAIRQQQATNRKGEGPKKKARLKRCSCLLPSSSVVAYSAHATFVSLQLVYPPRLPFNFLSVSLFLPCCLVGKKHAFSRMIVDEVNINRELGISSKVVVHALWNGCGTLLS